MTSPGPSHGSTAFRPLRAAQAVPAAGPRLGVKGYDSNSNRDALRERRILPVMSRKGCPNIKGLGKLRYVVEQTFALLHHSNASPSAGNAAPNSTMSSSPSPAVSSAGGDRRGGRRCRR